MTADNFVEAALKDHWVQWATFVNRDRFVIYRGSTGHLVVKPKLLQARGKRRPLAPDDRGIRGSIALFEVCNSPRRSFSSGFRRTSAMVSGFGIDYFQFTLLANQLEAANRGSLSPAGQIEPAGH